MAYCIKLSELDESRQKMVGGPWKGSCQDCLFPSSSSSSSSEDESSSSSSSSEDESSSSSSEGSSSSSEGGFFACVKQKNDPNSTPFCINFLSYDREIHQLTFGPFFGEESCSLCSQISPEPTEYYCIEPNNEKWLGEGNSANFKCCATCPASKCDPSYCSFTTVGTNGGPSHYGTYDQMGNAWEWTDDIVLNSEGGVNPGQRPFQRRYGFSDGNTEPSTFNKDVVFSASANDEVVHQGFRIATFTNPSGLNGDPEFVSVGDPGNAADFNGKGSVGYEYMIGKYTITNAQYANFLNFTARSNNDAKLYNPLMSSSDQGGIERTLVLGEYSYTTKQNMADKPVNFITWFSAARYCNWMHNRSFFGGSAGFNIPIETGAYELNGLNDIGCCVPLKNENAKYWIPTDDEWYKAAFYKGGGVSAGYWNYATQSDEEPSCVEADDEFNGITSEFESMPPTECVKVSEYSPEMGKIISGPTEDCSDCLGSSSSSDDSGLVPVPELASPSGFGDIHFSWTPNMSGSSTSVMDLYTNDVSKAPLFWFDDNATNGGGAGFKALQDEFYRWEWIEFNSQGQFVGGWKSTRKEVCIFPDTNICSGVERVGDPSAGISPSKNGEYDRQGGCRPLGVPPGYCGGCTVSSEWCSFEIVPPKIIAPNVKVGGAYVEFMQKLSEQNPTGGGANLIGKGTTFVLTNWDDPANAITGEAFSSMMTDLNNKSWGTISEQTVIERMELIGALATENFPPDSHPCCNAGEMHFHEGGRCHEDNWEEASCLYEYVANSWVLLEKGECIECVPPEGSYYNGERVFGTCLDCPSGQYPTPCGCLPSGCSCVEGSCDCPEGKTCPPPPTTTTTPPTTTPEPCSEDNDCQFATLELNEDLSENPENCEKLDGLYSLSEAEKIRDNSSCFYIIAPQPGYCCGGSCSPEPCETSSSSSSSSSSLQFDCGADCDYFPPGEPCPNDTYGAPAGENNPGSCCCKTSSCWYCMDNVCYNTPCPEGTGWSTEDECLNNCPS